MKELYVKFKNSSDVAKFTEAIKNLSGNFILADEMREINAKSILGIFGFNLSRPILLKADGVSENELKKISRFVYCRRHQ
jgi:phosphotransferase system HPr-like phosphotransfer protein